MKIFLIYGGIVLLLGIFIILFKNNIEINKSEKKDENMIYIPGFTDDITPLDKVIVGIDFGSSYSGFAYSIQAKEIVRVDKEPTVIIIDKTTQEAHKIGKDAIDILTKIDDNLLIFNRMKIQLDPELGGNDEIEADNNKKERMKLKQVIKEFLRVLYKKILDKLYLQTNDNYTKDDIKWIITVPAIWDEYGKQFMRDCAHEAGMLDVNIALEPEAASLTMFDDGVIDDEYKKIGKIFMLIDAGGYTVDITINKIMNNKGDIKQLSPPSGGAFGSIKINNEIEQIIKQLFGEEKIDNLKKINYGSWTETLKSIEDSKKNSDSDECKIYINFNEIICDKYMCEKTIEQIGLIKYDNDYVYIPKKIIQKIIENIVDEIIKHLKILYNKFNNIKIDSVILTGGFSGNEILKNEIKKNFDKISNIQQLSNPQSSVMNGAVIYGIKPNRIISRISPFTFGIGKYRTQITGTDCKNKIDVNGIQCEYFDKFIEINQEINNNHTVSKKYRPLYENQTSIGFVLYYSYEKDPIYIDHSKSINSISLEIVEMDLPWEKREFQVDMTFDSCITVQSKSINSGKKAKMVVNYYKRKN